MSADDCVRYGAGSRERKIRIEPESRGAAIGHLKSFRVSSPPNAKMRVNPNSIMIQAA
jgi:hypothetical protein